jgi:hypothetical protein
LWLQVRAGGYVRVCVCVSWCVCVCLWVGAGGWGGRELASYAGSRPVRERLFGGLCSQLRGKRRLSNYVKAFVFVKPMRAGSGEEAPEVESQKAVERGARGGRGRADAGHRQR